MPNGTDRPGAGPHTAKMSDPRNDAHDRKVTHQKKHQAVEAPRVAAPALAVADAEPVPPSTLDGALVVLAKLKELEFHSRAALERLAELTLTVGDELKQKDMVGPLGEVYAAQSTFQTRLTSLLEVYKAECDRMQTAHA